MNTKEKITALSTLKKRVALLRKRKKTIAFTNGCFDLLHAGHVAYLEKAKKANRVLIVGLNSDKSVRKIKGRGRPIVEQKQRAAVVAALACVDYVTIFNESTPYKTIKALEPDILIKGSDWKTKGVVGSDIVKLRGGKVELAKYIKGYSTTKLINSIRKKCGK